MKTNNRRMMIANSLVFFALPLLCTKLNKKPETVDEYLNTCADYGPRKLKPAPDPLLNDMCAPWKDRACCFGDKSNITMDQNLDYCDPHHILSLKCKRHFLLYNCMVFCSPNLGPWLHSYIPDNYFPQNLVHVPLCESACAAWWEDCKDDYSCAANWEKLIILNGCDTCGDTKLKPFHEFFSNAKSFCETILDDNFIVLPDTSPCMVQEFNGSNPNDEVARLEAERLVNQGSTHHPRYLLFFQSLIVCNVLLLF